MDFNVLIIGTDANAYYMARCFHEIYHQKATLVGKSPLPYTAYSDILEVRYFDDLWEEIGFLNAVFWCKKELGDKKTLLISSNETYAGFIAKNREKLEAADFVFNYPDKELIDTLMYKESFYKTYADSILDLPATVYYDCKAGGEIPETLTFPVIVKPSNVILYNHLTFEGKNKIYKVENRAELVQTVERICKGGYDDTLILQDFIPGDDSNLFDAVVYSDSTGKVRMLTLAQIGLQEHTRAMVGNAAVLINGYNQYGGTAEITEKIRTFMESIEYRGFAEFDLKYDRRDGKFKVLEINARQGRCSYYICALGCNPVKLLIEDLIEDKHPDYGLLQDEVLLSFVPKGIVKKYIQNNDYRQKALTLWKMQRPVNPLRYKADKNFKRKLYFAKRNLRYFKDYKNGYWKVDS
ncbi:MAG: carboxylate--amine ligase [Clostridia bacterium]|nr:carboxylate--amine ligase [Clostridia bacterium]